MPELDSIRLAEYSNWAVLDLDSTQNWAVLYWDSTQIWPYSTWVSLVPKLGGAVFESGILDFGSTRLE